METICLDTTQDGSDSSILTLKRKLSDPDVNDSKIKLAAKNKRIKPNDATTTRVTRSSARSKTNIEPTLKNNVPYIDSDDSEIETLPKRKRIQRNATATRSQKTKTKAKAKLIETTIESQKPIKTTAGSKKASKVSAEPKEAIGATAEPKKAIETKKSIEATTKAIESTSEPKKAITASAEPKKAIDATSGPKRATGVSVEPKKAIDATSELNKAIDATSGPKRATGVSVEPKKAIDATSELKKAIDSAGPKKAIDATSELNKAIDVTSGPKRAIDSAGPKKAIEATVEPKMAIKVAAAPKKANIAIAEPQAIEATAEPNKAIDFSAELKKAMETTAELKKAIEAITESKKVKKGTDEPKKTEATAELKKAKRLKTLTTSDVYYIDSDSEIEPSPKRIQRNAKKKPNDYKIIEPKMAIEVSGELRKALEAPAELKNAFKLTKSLAKTDMVPKPHQILSSDIYYIDSDSELESSPKKRKIQPSTVATKTSRLQTSKTKNAKLPNTIKTVGTIEITTEPKQAQINYIKLQPTTANIDFAPKVQITETYFNRNERYEHLLLAEKANLDIHTVKNIVQMFEAGNTIPFIARYRKHLTNEMLPEKLREVKEAYEGICSLKARTDTILKTLEKAGMLTDDLRNCIYNCRNLSELEHIYDPFKCGNKKTLASRAKSLGLETAALALLTGARDVDPNWFINKNTDGLRTTEEVERGIMHIIAHVISTDTEIIKFVRDLRQQLHLTIETRKSTAAAKDVTEAEANKFMNYFNFHIPVNHIKPHQVLAINRGENLKVLSVKLNIPDYAFKKFKYFCEHRWLDDTIKTSTRIRVFQESLKDCYKRLISPLIIRQTRSNLKATADKASIDVFTLNLKQLLLGTPLKGQPIMGIDPGYQHGCKVAIISVLGNVLVTGVIYPLSNHIAAKELVKKFLIQHNCSLIALGNGSACRQTESWLSDLIQTKYFAPLDVQYTIIDECGASIYSCSPEAKKEFPDMDALLVSAVSLARRVQDPLAELVKVEPKHLGVGMYQHDINKKALETALDEVVTECVSFVGVDLNTASHCILRKVAGLSPQRADNILAYRATKGPFTNRNQLMDVKSIGDKVFEQCAGFLRVGPSNSLEAKQFYSRTDTMPLDCTWIHPESYNLAEKIIQKFNLNYVQIGEPKFIKQFQETMKMHNIADLAKEFSNTEATIKLIVDVLSRHLDHDLRQETVQQPLFRKGITSLSDIAPDMVLTGRVTNVVHFGAFVDIGVGTNGLIHTTSMKGFTVHSQDRVEVKIQTINLELQRIGLEMVKKL